MLGHVNNFYGNSRSPANHCIINHNVQKSNHNFFEFEIRRGGRALTIFENLVLSQSGNPLLEGTIINVENQPLMV